MRSAATVAGLALAVALSSGCSSHLRSPLAPSANDAPAASTPAGAVERFAWTWNHRNAPVYRDLFTADYRFVFAIGDSAGNQFRDDPIGRDEELVIGQHIFAGGGSEPPATRIVLTIDATLDVVPDSRPGRNPTWHKEIVTTVDLWIVTDVNEYRVTGRARFFLVRGDSASIPADLEARGFRPDPDRWYIEQWNDETLPGSIQLGGSAPAAPGTGGFRALPARNITWGSIKSLYR